MVQASHSEGPMTAPSACCFTIREKWLDLFALAYSSRRATAMELEPGMHAVVSPGGGLGVYASPLTAEQQAARRADFRLAAHRIPELARGVRVSLDNVDQFGLQLASDFRTWLGRYAHDILSGEASATVFIDLTFLEAALLHELWDAEVLVDFNTPLSFFRRGSLVEYANVLEAVAAGVFEGKGIREVARLLACAVRGRLELYAETFAKLSTLYPQCHWRIESERFIMEVPKRGLRLSVPYWDLRGTAAEVEGALAHWKKQIESFLHEALPLAEHAIPKSFAA
jgi:hypothetical protein